MQRSPASSGVLRLLALFTLSLALLTVACGGDDEPEGASADAPSASTTANPDATGSPDAEATSDGGDDEDSNSGNAGDDEDGINPCSLVTKDEAEAALGKPVADGERPDVAQGLICQFVGSQGNDVWQLQVLVTQSGSAAAMTSAFASAKQSVAETNPEDVSGVGDEAFWIPGANQLNVRQGNTYLIVSGDASLEVLQGVAEKALDRL
jgi:hypothetical protein